MISEVGYLNTKKILANKLSGASRSINEGQILICLCSHTANANDFKRN